MKGRFLILIFLVTSYKLLAQDAIYSQFYNAPNYLNPALNGQFDGDLRLNFIHRASLVTLDNPLNYSAFSIDYNVPQFGGGFGFLATRSVEGASAYKRTTFSCLKKSP